MRFEWGQKAALMLLSPYNQDVLGPGDEGNAFLVLVPLCEKKGHLPTHTR